MYYMKPNQRRLSCRQTKNNNANTNVSLNRRDCAMDNVIWYVRQLLPLKYRTVYEEDGKRYSCEWRMWFGRCFDIKREEIA